jgi:hypothetical protein
MEDPAYQRAFQYFRDPLLVIRDEKERAGAIEQAEFVERALN